MRELPIISPAEAYPRGRRVRNAMRFIKHMALKGPLQFELTKARHVAATYGLDEQLIKKMKAKYRNEFCTGSNGK